MHSDVIRPEIGQWYARTDTHEVFQVVGRDDLSRTIEIQNYDGDVDEIEADEWHALPLETAAPPEDGTASMDIGEPDEAEYGDAGSSVQRIESWEVTEPEDERDPLGEGLPQEPFSADEEAARALL